MTKKINLILLKHIGKTTKPGKIKMSHQASEISFKKNYLILISRACI